MSWVFRPSHRGGSGPPLVCLHGLTDTWRTWDLVLPALERRHEVLAGDAGRARRRARHCPTTSTRPAPREGIGHCPQLDVALETAQLILGFTAP